MLKRPKNLRLIILLIILVAVIIVSLNRIFGFNIKIKFPERQENISEELRQKYLSDRFFCLKDKDCVVQKDCFCCGSVINKYNRQEVECQPNMPRCEAICQPFKVKCIDNRCKQVYK